MHNLQVLMVVFVIIGLFTIERDVHWIVYTIALLWLVIKQGGRYSMKKLKLSRSLSQGNWFVGDELSLVLTVQNPSWFPVFWCTFNQSFPAELGALRQQRLLTIPPFGKREFTIEFSGIARGIYPLPESRFVWGDAWGVNERVYLLDDRQQVIIFPRIVPLTGLEAQRHLPLGRLKVLFGLHEDPSRLRGCRDYQPGDSLKRIHWPNLARTGRLQVKEWESTLNADFVVLLDLCEANYPLNEWIYLREMAIEIAASVNHRLVNEGEKVGFICNGKFNDQQTAGLFKIPARRGRDQEVKVLSYLAGVDLSDGPRLETVLGVGTRFAAGSSLILITPTVSPELIQRAGTLRNKGYHPLFLRPQLKKVQVPLAELTKAQVPSFNVEKGRDSNVFAIRQDG